MKLKHLFLAAIMALAAIPSFAQSNQRKVMEAALNVYDQALADNPQDYSVLFRRGALFYTNDQYSRALADLDNAIKYTPATDSDLLSQEYALRASTYMMLNQTQNAYNDIKQACALDPSSYNYLFLKASLALDLGLLDEAKADYQRMGRMKSRSLESLIGLSKVAVKENNYGLANDYINQAVSLNQTDPNIYLQRAEILSLLGNNSGAVDDILMAIVLNPKESKAIEQLLALADTDYAAVISGLSRAIADAPDSAMFVLIRATIEREHFHFLPAIADFNTLIQKFLIPESSFDEQLGQCYYELCDYAKAQSYLTNALYNNPGNLEILCNLSQIALAQNKLDEAFDYAQKAKDAGYVNGVKQLAKCYMAADDYAKAQELYGEAIIEKPYDIISIIQRGWILEYKLNAADKAKNFYQRALDVADEIGIDNISALRGFALNLLGKKNEAREWMNTILANSNDVDGSKHYIAACLYAQIGDTDAAFKAMETSLSLGYAELFNWTHSNNPFMNVEPLRSYPQFNQLLSKYSHIFK